MNIHSFLYCFFNKFVEDKAPGYGRYIGSLYVAFAILIYILLLSKIIHIIKGNGFLDFSSFGAVLEHKRVYLWLTIIFWLINWLYFNTKRTDLLLEKYDKLYEETEGKTTFKMVLSLVVPLVLFVILMLI